jgi:hypothetical protein
MRALGILFVLVLVVAGSGWCRGWFGVQTSHAAARDRLEVVVDRDRIEADARAAADKVGELTGRAADAVKRAAQKVAGGERRVEAEVLAVDVAQRRLRVRLAGDDVDVVVPGAAAIVDAAEAPIPLSSLGTGARVRITFADRDEHLVVARVERI